MENTSREGRGLGITRRAFVTSSAVAALGLASCANEPPQTDSADGASSDSPGVVPITSKAQSLLLALSPDSLLSLAVDCAEGEDAVSGAGRSLPVIGPYTTAGATSYSDFLEELKPAYVVDVGNQASSRKAELEEMCAGLGCDLISIDLSEKRYLEAAQLISDRVQSPRRQAVLDELGIIQDIIDKAKDIPASDKFTVFAGGGEDGRTAYGLQASEGIMVENSGSLPVDVVGAGSGSQWIDIVNFNDEYDPEFVLLLNEAAGSGYPDNVNSTTWYGMSAGRLGCVFPALAGGSIWLGSMSELAQETLGAAWIACVLYPQYVQGRETLDQGALESLVADFYAQLFGTTLAPSGDAPLAATLIDARLPVTKQELVEEYLTFMRQRAQEADAVFDRLEASADPNNFTDEELLEVFDEYTEALGIEATDEQRQAYLDALRNR